MAARAEAAGWDGIAFTDSQNLVSDPFVAVAVAAQATSTLRFMTGVTNAASRDPAALATVAATAQEYAGGRFVLGIGRGDTALFHLGRPPQPVDAFGERLAQLRGYLGGGTVDRAGFPSRLRWLDRAQQPAVPIDLASAGPRVIALGARLADRVTFAVGADPDRVAWALGRLAEAAGPGGAGAPTRAGGPTPGPEPAGPGAGAPAAEAGPDGAGRNRPSGVPGAYVSVSGSVRTTRSRSGWSRSWRSAVSTPASSAALGASARSTAPTARSTASMTRAASRMIAAATSASLEGWRL